MIGSEHVPHGDVTLALTEQMPDGSMLYQSWPICSCVLAVLRKRLGPPHHESLATAEQAAATARAVQSVPGIAHVVRGEQ